MNNRNEQKMLTTFVLIIISILLSFVILIWNFDYWKKRGVTSPNPLPNIVNYAKALTDKQYMLNYLEQIYGAYKDREDFVGIYSLRTPQLLILSPELCQRIYVQNFQNFHDNEISTFLDHESRTFFGNNPFMLTGLEWKEARALLKAGLDIEMFKTAFFTTHKACKNLRLNIKDQIKKSVNIREHCLRFTSEIVTDCVFGFKFCGQPTTQFISNAISSTFKRTLSVSLYLLTVSLVPTLKKFYKTRLLPQRTVILFEKLMQTAVELRKSQKAPKGQLDFLNHLLDLQKQRNLTTMDLTTFTTAFMLHGLPAISMVLTHCLLMLSKHRNIQDRLRSEILRNLNENGEINWDNINQLTYLDACVKETIRILAPTSYTSKVCTEPILLTSKTGSAIKLKRGDIVVLPLHSIMNDENFYTNAKEFQPERFLDLNGSSSNYYVDKGLYFGFGSGPRKCIGEQFALTRIKAALITILSSFHMDVHRGSSNLNTPDSNDYNRLMNGEVLVDFKAVNLENIT